MKRHVKDLFDLTGKTGGLPFHSTANRFEFLNNGIRFAAGVFSLGLGGFIVYEKLVAG